MDKRRDSEENETANAIGAAAQSSDLNVAEPVSGMPAGGPHDLGDKAARGKPGSSAED